MCFRTGWVCFSNPGHSETWVVRTGTLSVKARINPYVRPSSAICTIIFVLTVYLVHFGVGRKRYVEDDGVISSNLRGNIGRGSEYCVLSWES